MSYIYYSLLSVLLSVYSPNDDSGQMTPWNTRKNDVYIDADDWSLNWKYDPYLDTATRVYVARVGWRYYVSEEYVFTDCSRIVLLHRAGR